MSIVPESSKMIYPMKFFIMLLVVLAVSVDAFRLMSNRHDGMTVKMALADYREELGRTAAAIAAPGMDSSALFSDYPKLVFVL